MTLPREYFDALYAAAPDPWGFRSRWYEERKRALTMALLPDAHYRTGYEPGCSVGVLTRQLAGRCDRLLATDVSAAAVTAATAATADLPQVRVETATLPADWPRAVFDLVVISELGYYFDVDDLRELASRAVAGTQTLVAVHWRHPVVDYPLRGDEVHAALGAAAARAGLTRLARHRDADLTADVWARDGRSVATRTGVWAPGS